MNTARGECSEEQVMPGVAYHSAILQSIPKNYIYFFFKFKFLILIIIL